ncbi:zinc-binding alcohol dehydrogenase family protein [Sulfuracidifex metallicus]|uniref:Zinc-binding alcohol dehydrogenase family protein n=1 Tax=Sulfuracidifex metallicus DSM 6482 = JCM 9184 TaxID=523847 RepID=A0A6A9QUI0_SULME|nr:zinc-binding alcohol dehydrogenase family protein [Sulfuracidifex metallicus]MUN28762.1 zinc-binding alcohol dehydrogenase family protein [Sulfuracidifex metallicus DSM 6482 = JCM 9184]WOE50721.1 zinc-binding alcohol dehydrogenase family protein [Sulfuracidifex metallicus DSM 6482 = JCM 9184]
MKAVVFDQGIIAKDLPPKEINKDFVALHPCSVLLNGIENAVYLGIIWIKPSTIIGSIGIGKVKDTGLEVDPSLRGRRILVTPYSAYGGIGTELNGLLSEEANVPYDSIEVIPGDVQEEALLLPFVSFARKVKERINGGTLLMLGGGLVSLITSAILKDYVSEIGVFTEGNVLPFKQFGVEIISNLDKKWDNIIISTTRSWARLVAPRLLRSTGKIFMPKIMNSWPLILSRDIEIVPINEINDEDYLILKKIGRKILEENIPFSGDIISSIPSSTIGTIIKVEEAFKNLRILP